MMVMWNDDVDVAVAVIDQCLNDDDKGGGGGCTR